MVAAAARRAGKAGKSRRPAHCGRVGRGGGLGRLLGNRGDRLAGQRARRAIVKTRLVRLAGKGLGGARAHLRYIQRDGAVRDGGEGRLYDAASDGADGRAFLERSGGDRHQFRLILSPEDGDQYQELKPLVRRFMAQLEDDLGTRLEWVAADHDDTGRPHAHVILRGRDEHDANLVIARDYISAGMRARLCELVSRDLGPRQDVEIRSRLRAEVSAERLTSIDRSLLRGLGAQRTLDASHRDPFWRALRAGRLKKLEQLGLAEPLGGGRWVLVPRLEQRLRLMGERADIIRTMQRELGALGSKRASADLCVHDGAPGLPITGRLLARGLADEHSDRHFLIVDAIDGRIHWIDAGPGAGLEAIPAGAIVRIQSRQSAGDGRRAPPLRVELLSPLPLEALAKCDGFTWLDRQLGSEAVALRDSGFGHAVSTALAARGEWLAGQGLAEEHQGRLALRPGVRPELQRREIAAAAARIERELGLPFQNPGEGGRVSGLVRRRVDLACGQFALVEGDDRFALVPWRPTLGRSLGKEVAGIARGGDVRWISGRERGGPSLG